MIIFVCCDFNAVLKEMCTGILCQMLNSIARSMCYLLENETQKTNHK